MNSIRQVFGNHNSYRLFMNLISNIDAPLLKPVLYREVNGPNAKFINSKTRHNKLMRDLSRELNAKYPEYQIN